MKGKKKVTSDHLYKYQSCYRSSPTFYYAEIFNEILWYFYMSHHIKDCNDDDTDNNILLKTNSSLRGFCINTDQWNEN